MELLNKKISCPYCGELIELLIDDSAIGEDYYEDCSVCCRPIRVLVGDAVDGDCSVEVLRDDD